ncbi:Ig-like domain-containing protein [Neobacillus sp. WH10]|uniref:Ig-like domain-containing protein n=1 Tax=Neobacillus sp. WH10 TaxID=3047873 RepID=UPI0024C15117|nr:Ig-like domain-containing protein [Neobacillus sp. WH10]WHY77406.1 Ig-like domain-containing protein [Neobacillus sp. WH10]
MGKRMIAALTTFMLVLPSAGLANTVSESSGSSVIKTILTTVSEPSSSGTTMSSQPTEQTGPTTTDPEPNSPTIESVSITPDDAKPGDIITITAKINSPVYGVKKVQANLNGYTGKQIDLNYNSADGTWSGTYQVQDYDHQGKWHLAFDIYGNEYWWYRYTDQSITVVNPNEDRVKPVMSSFRLEPQPVKAGEPFTVTIKAADASGIKSVKADFQMPNGWTKVGQPLTYDSKTDQWSFSYTFSENTEPGTCGVMVQITDLAGNVTTEVKDFELTNVNADYTPPKVENITVSKQVLNLGDQLKVTAKITDDKSGVASAELHFFGKNQYQSQLAYNPATGLWETTFRVDPYMEAGTYKLDLQVYDKAQNLVYPEINHTVRILLAKPVVNQVTDSDMAVSGQSQSGTKIEVKAGEAVIGTATASADGSFTATIPVQKQGTKLVVSATADSENAAEETTITVAAKNPSGWVTTDGKRYYYDPVIFKPKTAWFNVGGTWYYANNTGVVQTGWLKQGSTWYYLTGSGAMATGWQKVGMTWYYFNSGGAMITGWQKVGTTWYYFNSGGAMVTGWQKVGTMWYYFNSGGAMVTGWQKVGTTWYYFNSSGAMVTGWAKISGKSYYFYSSGALR